MAVGTFFDNDIVEIFKIKLYVLARNLDFSIAY